MKEKTLVPCLKISSINVGRFYPVLLDKYGNVVDGVHRLAADENWPKIILPNIKTEEQRLIARIISNTCRRHVRANEKTEMLTRLAEIYLKKGFKPGSIAQKIAEETGMSYTWVMKYLPDKFKDNMQSERASAATRRVAVKNSNRHTFSFQLEDPPKEAIIIRVYGNTNFVNVLLKRQLYRQLEERSKNLK